jgi:hypothetical protein
LGYTDGHLGKFAIDGQRKQSQPSRSFRTTRITRDTTREISMRAKTLKGSERRGSHAVDWCHFMTVAHADEFVTADGDFRKILEAAPSAKPEILSLEEWVERLRRQG